ncbi:MAG: carboxylesterase [Planctomycetota bacterium]
MNEKRELLPCVEVVTRQPTELAVIWLHGLGADGHDFEPLVPYLALDDLPIRFVFPHAPSMPVSINGGFVMPAWYDIREGDLRKRHDEDGVRQSHECVLGLIEREARRGIPPERLVLAGFSQGGAIALFTGLRFPERLAGILALSTYLVCEDSLEAERSEANRDVPILQAHGQLDPMVPIERGRAARDRMRALGYSVTWEEYPMQHEVCPDEIADIGAWLRETLARTL